MNIKEKQKLKKFVIFLMGVRGRHTELVTVYIPSGYDLNKVINHLQQEQGTASNIKDARTRANVIDSLEKMVRHLRLFKRTPDNGLAVFAGNVSQADNKIDIQVFSIEPPEQLKVRIYRCDQTFYIDLLKDMMEHSDIYGLIVMDKREAAVGFLKGTSIKMLHHLTSGVPGKTRAGGQCNAFGTLVQSSTGNILKIEEVHNPIITKSVNIKNYTLENSKIIDKWYVKKNKVYKITTKYPQLMIESSKDHLFLVATEEGIIEKAAEELNENDTLIMPERIDIEGKIQKLNSKQYYNSFIINKEGQKLLIRKRRFIGLLQRQLAKKIGLTQTAISFVEIGKRKLDHEFAQFLGYFIGDGCSEKDRITFFEQRKEVAIKYKNKFDKYLNLNSSYKFRESKNYHQLRFTSRPLVRLIIGEFPEIKKALDTEVPKKILESKNNIIASFLRGVFDADGYVSKRDSLGIGLNNKILVGQLQLLLLRFSILSSFQEYDNKNNPYSDNPIFKLKIGEKESIENYKKYIGFTSEEKTNDLIKLINKKNNMSRVRRLIISGKNIRKIIEEAGYNIQLFPKVSNFFRDERMMSKKVFYNSVLNVIKNKDKKLYTKLYEIYNKNILPVKISKIEVSHKPTKMVDISTQSGNFIANGLIVHNSSNRFARLRDEAAKEFYNRISEIAQKEFIGKKELKGILVGGPGHTKEEFIEYLNNELRQKIIAMKDLTYTDESGLYDLVERSADVLAQEAVIEEKKIMNRFFTMLATEQNKTAYGIVEVKKALEIGAVDILLVSEDYDEKELEEIEKMCEKTGTKLQLISLDTVEGKQLKDLGRIAAILRYEIY
ncbi:hypothetical protein HYX16_03395 [Candidatus Woesearchaeota archaeon]|nr:hypothetical protein [Candidatus Woesearchaeota archaeon]